MSLDKSNTASDRTRVLKNRAIYSNYLAANTRFEQGLSGRPPRIIGGSGASGESSAATDIAVGQISITPAEQASIIAANSVPPFYGGSLSSTAGAYLTSDPSTDFSMGTGDFTVECWANTNQLLGGGWTNLVAFGYNDDTTPFHADIRLAAGGDFYSPNGGKIGFIIPKNDGTDDRRFRYNGRMTHNTWYHLALVRHGGRLDLYVNGTRSAVVDDGTGTQYPVGVPVSFDHSGDPSDQKSRLFINGSLYDESQFDGLISNIRLVKGQAIYTANFTVPTTPLTAVPGTVLLMNTSTGTNYLQDSENHTLTPTGSLSYSPSNPFI